MKGYVLTSRRQMGLAAGVAAAGLWMGACTAAMLVNLLSASSADREIARTRAKYERWIADRQARLNFAVAQLDAADGAPQRIATTLEKQHAALAMLLSDVKGEPGAAEALTPVIARGLAGPDASPGARIAQVEQSQDQLLDAADAYAHSRADRLRLAFRLAGLAPTAYLPEGAGLGGPLVDTKDPRALAAVLDVDPGFAVRIRRAAADLSEAHELAEAARQLPLSRPTHGAERSSGYGVRIDPFTRRPAFHPGLDFAGGRMTPVYATGPGVVAFTGVRSGYGRTVEVDHGGGLKTRYAHLQAISVHPGERVALGERLGGMGSTGRSTGPHLHYEVWLNGRSMNPDRFLRAGELVRAPG
jgi:murein DD-endopeptidase MepM/ murein hydrolase activator NlpD